jgi:hypothetical protein
MAGTIRKFGRSFFKSVASPFVCFATPKWYMFGEGLIWTFGEKQKVIEANIRWIEFDPNNAARRLPR